MYGTNTTLDTLAATQQTIAQIGEDHAFDAVETELMAQNKIVRSMLGDFVEPTIDRLRRYGTAALTTMDELDELGTADAQKISAGVICGFPLKRYGTSLQWTRMFFQVAKAAEFAAQVKGVLIADVLKIQRDIKRALFNPVNYTFNDRLVDHLQQIPLPVKAFVNADGANLPAGPNGEIFNGSTHTHYLAATTLDDTSMPQVIETVLEHYGSGQALVYINRAQEATVRALTKFTRYVDARIVPQTITDVGLGVALDPVNIYNRAIGLYDGAEVWVKPWMPANYVFSWIKGQPAPLVFRKRDDQGGDLVLEYEDESHPLRAQAFAREFGVAPWNRTNGAVLYIGGTTYVTPTITG